MARILTAFLKPKTKNMKKTTLMIAAAMLSFTAFSQTTTVNDQGMQNQTNQSNQNQNNQNNKGNQNNTNNNPQQNPPGQNNNVNKSDWNNQAGQSGADKQNTQNNQPQDQNLNQGNANAGQQPGNNVPPSVVTNRFTTDYPGMQANWSRDHMNNYRASYRDAGSNSNRSVTYDKTGNVISRDMELGDNDYPTGISDYFTKNNMKDKHSVWSSEDKDGNKIYYSNYNNKTYWFDKNGNYNEPKGKHQGSGTDKNNNTKNNSDNKNSKDADQAAPKKDKSTNKEMRKKPQ
jgi:hypothetical protein